MNTINKRRYARVSTFFPCEFSIKDVKHYMMDEFWHGSKPCQGETIIITARILNICEGGLFADYILAFNPKTEKAIDRPEIIGHKLYNLNFTFGDNGKIVNTKGRFIRLQRDGGRLRAAIGFNGINKISRKIIREYIGSHIYGNNEDQQLLTA